MTNEKDFLNNYSEIDVEYIKAHGKDTKIETDKKEEIKEK